MRDSVAVASTDGAVGVSELGGTCSVGRDCGHGEASLSPDAFMSRSWSTGSGGACAARQPRGAERNLVRHSAAHREGPWPDHRAPRAGATPQPELREIEYMTPPRRNLLRL